MQPSVGTINLVFHAECHKPVRLEGKEEEEEDEKTGIETKNVDSSVVKIIEER